MSGHFSHLINDVKDSVISAFEKVYPEVEVSVDEVEFDRPPSLDMGDLALPCFPWAGKVRTNPAEIAGKLADAFESKWVKEALSQGPYLNLRLDRPSLFRVVLAEALAHPESFGNTLAENPDEIMVEYSSPNTNKPMHLGHVRNNALGMALTNLLKSQGHEVTRVNLVNDRGIHICKSMVAYQKWGKGKTPKSTGVKGDHFVGKYYVRFDRELKKERQAFFEEADLPYSSSKLTEREWADLLVDGGLVERGIVEELLGEKESRQSLDKALLKAGYLDKKSKKKARSIKKKEERKRAQKLDEVEEEFLNQSELMTSARQMLQDWEGGREEVRQLWEKMNSWVYDGFKETYRRLGCEFEVWNFESETYQLGKQVVEEGLKKGVFEKRKDGSVWAPLEGKRDGLPLQDKVVLRSDGTSVYITQDLGTAIHRFREHEINRLVYVVASEQRLHFATLFEILSRLGYEWAEKCYHASYGMVTLPQGRGKLKSREGTAVDADALLDELEERVREKMIESGYHTSTIDKSQMMKLAWKWRKEAAKKWDCEVLKIDMSPLMSRAWDELQASSADENTPAIALGALKFFILHVSPSKDFQFDPDQAIHFTGDSGPSTQYSYTRIRSIFRKASEKVGEEIEALQGKSVEELKSWLGEKDLGIGQLEKREEWELALLLFDFPSILHDGAEKYSPALVANYLLDLTKAYARFWDQCPVLQAESKPLMKGRLALCLAVGIALKRGLEILGIPAPEKM